MSKQTTFIESVVAPKLWRLALASNTAATSFAAIAPTVTKPTSNTTTGIAIIPCELSVLKLCFFGTDAADETFDVKIVAWSKIVTDADDADNRTGEFIPTLLAHLSVTLGTTTGAAGGVVGGTGQLFADTITLNDGTTAINVISPADNTPSMVELSNTGAQQIGLYFDMTGAASANALYMNT